MQNIITKCIDMCHNPCLLHSKHIESWDICWIRNVRCGFVFRHFQEFCLWTGTVQVELQTERRQVTYLTFTMGARKSTTSRRSGVAMRFVGATSTSPLVSFPISPFQDLLPIAEPQVLSSET